jgi:hypothetical protein
MRDRHPCHSRGEWRIIRWQKYNQSSCHPTCPMVAQLMGYHMQSDSWRFNNNGFIFSSLSILSLGPWYPRRALKNLIVSSNLYFFQIRSSFFWFLLVLILIFFEVYCFISLSPLNILFHSIFVSNLFIILFIAFFILCWISFSILSFNILFHLILYPILVLSFFNFFLSFSLFFFSI